jgi:ATP-binding cassette, subfamily B, bacterial
MPRSTGVNGASRANGVNGASRTNGVNGASRTNGVNGASRTPDGPGRSPFVPVGVEPRYAAPRAAIGPASQPSWLKRALPVVMAHKWVFGASLALSFAGLVIQVRIPVLMAQAINESIQRHAVTLAPYVIWIAALAVARGLLTGGARYCLLRTAYDVEYDLRTIIYEHLTRMSFSFYDKVQSGQLISRANSDIRAVQMYLTFGPSVLVQCAVVVVAFVQMLFISWPLALVAMVTMPFVWWVGVRMRKVLFPVSWLIQARLADVANIVDENINGVRVVKSFAAEQSQLTTLARAADRVRWAYTEDADVRARWAPAIENLPRVGLAFVLLLGGWMAIHGATSVGAIVAFNAYVLMLQPPFRQLGMIIMMGQRASASANRIYEVLDTEPDVTDRPGATDLVSCRGDVRFEAVSFGYGEGPPVLNDFSLRLRPGETVALVGRTGAGKSTVARLLERFYDVRSGAITVDGHDVRDLTVVSLRAHIGVVTGEPFLFSVSIRDNIAYGRPGASEQEVTAAATAAGADAFIRSLPDGYATVVGERGYTLSGGQRQRIAIARTLLLNPPILILDDATSAIDAGLEQAIHGALIALLRGRTTLVIAHRLSTISLADRVVLLADGSVIADGTHTGLLATEPRYAEVLAQAEAEGLDVELAASGGLEGTV